MQVLLVKLLKSPKEKLLFSKCELDYTDYKQGYTDNSFDHNRCNRPPKNLCNR